MQTNNEIKFGTDGWRGIISDNFTFANVRKVARAIADYYQQSTVPASPAGGNSQPSTKIAVGYDTRFLSDKYAKAVADILVRNGIDVTLSDRPVPTPCLSFAVKKRGMTSGVMITASHNPADYNGIKIKTASGGAAGVDVTNAVEKLISESPSHRVTESPGKFKTADLTKDYVSFLRSYLDLRKLKDAKHKVLVDVMHGSGNGFIAQILKGTRVRLEFTRQDINPSFEGLRPEPVLENLEQTQERMRKEKFDICLVLDGDADRIAAFAGGGEFIYPQKVLGLLALHLIEDRRMSGGLVKTIVGSNLIDNIAKGLGLKLYETPVGFKYISDLMQKEDILVGGEEAGGMGFKNYIPERDGSLAGLLLLEMMAYRKKNMLQIVEDMERKFGRYYYLRQDLKLPVAGYSLPQEKIRSLKELAGKEITEVKDYDGIKLLAQDQSWLMFRGSGTEPIMRVYAESASLNRTKKLLALGKELILKDALSGL